MGEKTVEGKGSAKNGICRMIFVVLSILLEAGFIISIFPASLQSRNRYKK